MQGLRIFSRTGAILSSEEIEAAHRVANAHGEMSYGTIDVVDQLSGVRVEYFPFKNQAFVTSNIGSYFGFYAPVEMRCRCKGVVLLETEAPDFISMPFIIPEGSVQSDEVYGCPDCINPLTEITISYLAFYDGANVINGTYHAIRIPPDDTGTTFVTDNRVFSSPIFYYASEIEAARLAELEANQVAASNANYRSAVFLTDGTQLASSPISYISPPNEYQPIFNKDISGNITPWSGGESAALFDSEKNRVTDLTFDVPADVCFNKIDNPPTYSGTDGGNSQWIEDWENAQKIGLERENNRRLKCSQSQHLLLRNGFLPPEFEYFIKTTAPVSSVIKREYPMQVISISQELTSDSTDDNDKRTRLYTATVIIQYADLDIDGNEVLHEEGFTGTVRLEDIAHKKDGSTVATSKRLTYTNFPMLSGDTGKAYPLFHPLPELPYEASIRLKTVFANWHDAADYPLFVEANGVFLDTEWLEDNTYGTPTYPRSFISLTPPVQKTRDELVFTHPQFLLDYMAVSKPIEDTTPPEIIGVDEDDEPIFGEGGASTNWLSSRLSNNEIIRIVPLNFVGGEFGNYGMFPFRLEDDDSNSIIEQLRIYGYAEFKYSVATASFTFVKWVEFIEDGNLTIRFDDEVTLDDELNPTTITVISNGESKTYTLAPKSFDYDEEWGPTNCIGIAGKAPWTDTKAAAKEQKKNISDNPPEGYELTPEERLYHEVRLVIS